MHHFSSCYMQLHSPSLLVHLPSLSHLCLPFFSSSLFNSSLMWTGYFLGSWMIGVALSTMCIFCFPGKLPIPWNLSGYSFARSSIFFISLFVSTVVILQLICTNPSCMDDLKPNIAVSFSHIKNFAFIVGEFLCLIFSIIEPYCSILVPFTAHRVVISLFTLLGISMLP